MDPGPESVQRTCDGQEREGGGGGVEEEEEEEEEAVRRLCGHPPGGQNSETLRARVGTSNGIHGLAGVRASDHVYGRHEPDPALFPWAADMGRRC